MKLTQWAFVFMLITSLSVMAEELEGRAPAGPTQDAGTTLTELFQKKFDLIEQEKEISKQVESLYAQREVIKEELIQQQTALNNKNSIDLPKLRNLKLELDECQLEAICSKKRKETLRTKAEVIELGIETATSKLEETKKKDEDFKQEIATSQTSISKITSDKTEIDKTIIDSIDNFTGLATYNKDLLTIGLAELKKSEGPTPGELEKATEKLEKAENSEKYFIELAANLKKSNDEALAVDLAIIKEKVRELENSLDQIIISETTKPQKSTEQKIVDTEMIMAQNLSDEEKLGADRSVLPSAVQEEKQEEPKEPKEEAVSFHDTEMIMAENLSDEEKLGAGRNGTSTLNLATTAKADKPNVAENKKEETAPNKSKKEAMLEEVYCEQLEANKLMKDQLNDLERKLEDSNKVASNITGDVTDKVLKKVDEFFEPWKKLLPRNNQVAQAPANNGNSNDTMLAMMMMMISNMNKSQQPIIMQIPEKIYSPRENTGMQGNNNSFSMLGNRDYGLLTPNYGPSVVNNYYGNSSGSSMGMGENNSLGNYYDIASQRFTPQDGLWQNRSPLSVNSYRFN